METKDLRNSTSNVDNFVKELNEMWQGRISAVTFCRKSGVIIEKNQENGKIR